MAPNETQVIRLSKDQYDKLVKDIGSVAIPFSGSATTEQQAGFMLGIQFVLLKLREGYVVGA